jgi:hypothetical protein
LPVGPFNEPFAKDAALASNDHAVIEIETRQDGRLGPLVMGLVVECALQHRDELLEDWRLARESASLNRIAPLELEGRC